jgi:hypothetical protein
MKKRSILNGTAAKAGTIFYRNGGQRPFNIKRVSKSEFLDEFEAVGNIPKSEDYSRHPCLSDEPTASANRLQIYLL